MHLRFNYCWQVVWNHSPNSNMRNLLFNQASFFESINPFEKNPWSIPLALDGCLVVKLPFSWTMTEMSASHVNSYIGGHVGGHAFPLNCHTTTISMLFSSYEWNTNCELIVNYGASRCITTREGGLWFQAWSYCPHLHTLVTYTLAGGCG